MHVVSEKTNGKCKQAECLFSLGTFFTYDSVKHLTKTKTNVKTLIAWQLTCCCSSPLKRNTLICQKWRHPHMLLLRMLLKRACTFQTAFANGSQVNISRIDKVKLPFTYFSCEMGKCKRISRQVLMLWFVCSYKKMKSWLTSLSDIQLKMLEKHKVPCW